MTDNHIKAHDDAIRKDERDKAAKEYDKGISLIAKGLELLDKAANPAFFKEAQPNGSAAPKAKANAPKGRSERKVKTTPESMDKVLALLQLPPQPALQISEVDRALNMGPRFVGAALRQLVAEGKATVKGGKYRAVAEAQAPQWPQFKVPDEPSDGAEG